MSGGDYPVIGAGIDVEVVETRSAGWAFRCHPCDITTVNLTEAEARTLHNGHVHRAADLGDMLRRGRIEIKSGDEGSAVTLQAVGPVLPSCPVCRQPIGGARYGGGRIREDGPTTPLIATAQPCGCQLNLNQYKALKGALRPLWRFDVPEIPARVTAVEDGMGWTWVRDGAAWVLWGRPASYRVYDRDLIVRLPLVECEDPRGTG